MKDSDWKDIGWWTVLMLIGSGFGSMASTYDVQKDCDVSGNHRFGDKVYQCSEVKK